MKRANGLLLLASIFISTLTFAQEDVIIIDKGKLKSYKSEREIKLNDNIQVFKFAPLNMLGGEINFGYERQVSKKGSIDIEIGPTISKIGLGVNSHFVDPWSTTPTSIENSGMGFLTTFGYRFYPLDETEALNRFYVSPVLKYKLLNHTVEDLSGTLQDANGSNSQFNFYFNFGYQLWAAKYFAIDFYGGIGIGYQNIRDYYIASEFVNNDWNYYWQSDIAKGARYVFNAGIKVGIGKE
jgi:hypothetical protein